MTDHSRKHHRDAPHRAVHADIATSLALACAVGFTPVAAKADSIVVAARVTAAGALDTTFRGDGTAVANLASTLSEEGYSAALTSAGKVVVAGMANTSQQRSSGQVFMLTRFNSDGTLDTTFGTSGFTVTDFVSSGTEVGTSVAIDSSNRIVVAGRATDSSGAKSYFAAARYTANGALDTTFDGDGKVIVDFASSDDESAADLAISSNGRIVLGGTATDSNGNGLFALARLTSTGALDTTFDGDGKVLTAFQLGDADISGIAIDGNGRIVAGGGVAGYFAAARYNSNGSLDTTFDGDGTMLVDFASVSGEAARDVKVDSSNRVILAGTGVDADLNSLYALARLNSNGSLDTSFDGDGKVLTDFASSSNEKIWSVALSGSKIVVGGNAGRYLMSGARYNSNGSLDTTFDGDGKILVNVPEKDGDNCTNVLIDSSGKVILVGWTQEPFTL